MYLFNIVLGIALMILGAISILAWGYLFYLLIKEVVEIFLAHKRKKNDL